MKPKQNVWSSKELLSSLSACCLHIDATLKDNYECILWNDLCSEYDSRNLCLRLQFSRNSYSEAFNSLLELWAADESNHAEGFKIIYAAVYGCEEGDIDARLRGRKVDFSVIEEFIGDEFKLCLLLAYDELATTYSYHGDIPLYRSLGHAPLEGWIRRVKLDEALHFYNLLQVIKNKHSHRIAEAEDILLDILELDLSDAD
ncbi:MAG: hypothetical protein HY074_06055, partial [Deltaproteobacteria bacterium]|nr:hypothetical protein [Deltaproteobacteria bacterium]